jgi:hypothetical protein
MVVTTDDEWHFKITDNEGTMHYVECYGCALNLIKSYETLHIETFCDWYGPNYTITVDSKGYGAQVNINPTAALYLNGGSCEANRVAYNQTAADALKNGFSQYTSMFQQHDWDNPPTLMAISQAVELYNGTPTKGSTDSLLLPTVIGVGSVIGAATGFVAYKKLRRKQD